MRLVTADNQIVPNIRREIDFSPISSREGCIVDVIGPNRSQCAQIEGMAFPVETQSRREFSAGITIIGIQIEGIVAQKGQVTGYLVHDAHRNNRNFI